MRSKTFWGVLLAAVLLISGCGSDGAPAPPLSRDSVEFLLKGVRSGDAALRPVPPAETPGPLAGPVECSLFDYPGPEPTAASGWVRAVVPENGLIVDAASKDPADPYHVAFTDLLTSTDRCRSFTSSNAAVEIRRYQAPALGTAAALVSAQSEPIRRQGLQQRILLVASDKLLLRLSGPLILPGAPVADQLTNLARELLNAADGERGATTGPAPVVTAAPAETQQAAEIPGAAVEAPAAAATETPGAATAPGVGPASDQPPTAAATAADPAATATDEVLADALSRYFDPEGNRVRPAAGPARDLLAAPRNRTVGTDPAACRVLLDTRAVGAIPGMALAYLQGSLPGQDVQLEVHSDVPANLLAAEFAGGPAGAAGCGSFSITGSGAASLGAPQVTRVEQPQIGDASLMLLTDTGIGFAVEQRAMSGNLSVSVTLLSLDRPESERLAVLNSTARTLLAHLKAELSMR